MTFLTLFFISFGAATLLPGGSEALFLYELSQPKAPIYGLLIIASIGNTLGSLVNYLLGKHASEWSQRKGYMSPRSLMKANQTFLKYGPLALMLSWVPIIGDPLTFIAGVARYSSFKFMIIVGFAKTARYVFLMLPFV